MRLIWVYIFLYLTSLVIMIWFEPTFHKETNNWYSPFLYAIAIVIGSFFLIGIIQITVNVYRTIKDNWKILMIKLLIWRIKHKYKIK